jgi:hypothetical protein
MAVDTREKRMNAATVGRPYMRARHAVGATDEQSRIASGLGYGGNALSPGADEEIAQARSSFRFVFSRHHSRVN